MPALVSEWMGKKLGASPYQVLRLLQTGGMAIVYLGQELHTGRSVVIKTPRPDSPDETLAARLESEIRVLRAMSHPHVVPILDAGEYEGAPFLVLPYLEGGTLLDRSEGDEPQCIAAFQGWLLPIAEALDFLHSHGWIHRDVKPANILFDGANTPYLADLGLTKCYSGPVRRSLTRLGVPSPGTPRYMSPELLAGEVADGRADQYSLAVMLYEMLTGLAPYSGDSPTAVLRNQALVQPTPLKKIRPNLPQTLSDVIARGMAFKSAQRYANCTDFAQAFLAALPTVSVLPTAVETNPKTWSIDEFPALPLPQPERPSPANTPMPVRPPAYLITPPTGPTTASTMLPRSVSSPWRARLMAAGWMMLGLFIGMVFIPGTALHRRLAGPFGAWLQENLNLTLPWMRHDQIAEEHKALEERTLTLSLELADARKRSEDTEKTLTKDADALRESLRHAEETNLAHQKERARELERLRAIETHLPMLKESIHRAEAAIQKAIKLHEEIDARVVLINNTDRAVTFKLKGQFWDDTWGDWQTHTLQSGQRDIYTVPQAMWLRVQVMGSEEHEDLRPQIFLHGRDKMSVDVHYQFDRGPTGIAVSRLVRAK